MKVPLSDSCWKPKTVKRSLSDFLRAAGLFRAASVFSSKLFVEEAAEDVRSFGHILVGSFQQKVPEGSIQ